MKRMLCRILAWCLFFLMGTPLAFAETILYVPVDDRPVSLEYAVDTLKAASLDVLVPPTEYLASRNRSGDPTGLWQWLKENASKADVMVLSADTMIYGGLVDSRTHNLNSSVLEWRMKRISQLREINPNVRLFVFSTIMRSPQASAGGVEPPYYEKYGGDIFQITSLQDKAEVKGLTADEQKILQAAQAAVPSEYFSDWMKRRNKNFQINAELVELTKNGAIDYLLMGRDDTSPYSQSHKESRMLAPLAGGLTTSKFATFPGADQLGMVLLARAYNDLMKKTPVVEVKYALGSGAATIASYEDQPIGRTIIDHITAAGGVVSDSSGNPDLVLAVNTPLTPHTEEAEIFDNIAMNTENIRQFVGKIDSALKAGMPVAVADVAFANGADNSLMKGLYERSLLQKLSAYSGWNTASNTLGYAIGQGMMAKSMAEKERTHLLAVRYLDDWAYQANIRKELYREVLAPRQGSPEYLGWLEPELAAALKKKTQLFIGKYLWMQPEKIKVSFPWNRMFEIRVEVGQ